MQNVTIQLPVVDASRADGNLPFKIVALYDSVMSLAQARSVRCRLAAEFRNQVDVESSFWYHALLSHPQLREQAAREASQADMIVVSVSDSLGISPAFVDWIDKSLSPKPRGSAALVLLLDHKRGLDCTSALSEWMKQIASQYGIEFFTRPDRKRPDVNQVVPPARKTACTRAVTPLRISTVAACAAG